MTHINSPKLSWQLLDHRHLLLLTGPNRCRSRTWRSTSWPWSCYSRWIRRRWREARGSVRWWRHLNILNFAPFSRFANCRVLNVVRTTVWRHQLSEVETNRNPLFFGKKFHFYKNIFIYLLYFTVLFCFVVVRQLWFEFFVFYLRFYFWVERIRLDVGERRWRGENACSIECIVYFMLIGLWWVSSVHLEWLLRLPCSYFLFGIEKWLSTFVTGPQHRIMHNLLTIIQVFGNPKLTHLTQKWPVSVDKYWFRIQINNSTVDFLDSFQC